MWYNSIFAWLLYHNVTDLSIVLCEKKHNFSKSFKNLHGDKTNEKENFFIGLVCTQKSEKTPHPPHKLGTFPRRGEVDS